MDNKYLSSIDFELAFANNNFFGDDGEFEADLMPDEIEVNIRSTLKNDRWGIDFGNNYVIDSGLSTNNNGNISPLQNYATQDLTVEYYITEDRRLKLRVYGRNDFDLVLGTAEREQRYGVGISYRKEFGSFKNFKEELNNRIDNAVKKQR